MDVGKRNRKVRSNGHRAEITIERSINVKARGKSIIDYPDHPDFGELKSVERVRRGDSPAFSRVVIEKSQVDALKRSEKLLLVYVHELRRAWAVHPFYLNGDRKVSWRVLADMGTEIEI